MKYASNLRRTMVGKRPFVAGRANGLTRYEFLIRIALVGVLAVILLERMLYYQEYAEKTVMEATIVNIRSGMRLHIADLMMSNKTDEIAEMLNQNPMQWLQNLPSNYIGEVNLRSEGDISKGSWAYEFVTQELIYTPRLRRFFDGNGHDDVRFRVHAKVLVTQENNSGKKIAEGIEIMPIYQYKWF